MLVKEFFYLCDNFFKKKNNINSKIFLGVVGGGEIVG